MFGKLDLHIARAGLSPVLVYTVRGPQGEPVRALSSGGVFQSATYLGERRMEPVFEYYRAFGRVLDGIAAPAPRVLVVGGGGFAVPKLARASRPETTIEVVEIDPKVMAHTEAIILSMTPEERENPKLLGASRKKRVAAGCGLEVVDVNRLLKQFEAMQQMLKQFNRGRLPGMRGGFRRKRR